jgi:hypothetical protein
MEPRMASALAISARDMGAMPELWRGTFEAVTREHWDSVESFDGKKWRPIAVPPGRKTNKARSGPKSKCETARIDEDKTA